MTFGDDLVIARRELLDTKSNEVVTVLVYMPTQQGDGEWNCTTEVRAGTEAEVLRNPGTDALAALILGIRSLRYVLKKRGIHHLSWLGVEGWIGLPVVTSDTDEGYLTVIENLLEAESARQALVQRAVREDQKKKG